MRNKPKPIQPKVSWETVENYERGQPKWLWHPYVPAGAITLIYGDGGVGKSFLTCEIAAAVSTGRALPGQHKALPAQKVLMLSGEDHTRYVLRPRLEDLGADLSNIIVPKQTFVFDDATLRSLRQKMREVSATVIIDPIVFWMGSERDMNRANEVREMMGKLARAAEESECPVIVVHHIRKASSSNAKHRSAGSADFINASRSAMLVEEANGSLKVLHHTKNNWSGKGDSLLYEIEVIEDGHLGDDDMYIADPHFAFHWRGQYTEPETGGKIRPRGHAKAFLQALLKDGPVPAVEVTKRAKDEGIARNTLDRAKASVAESFRQDDKWYWRLIEDRPVFDSTPSAGNEQRAVNGEESDLRKYLVTGGK